jgi:hypothetical protein
VNFQNSNDEMVPNTNLNCYENKVQIKNNSYLIDKYHSYI